MFPVNQRRQFRKPQAETTTALTARGHSLEKRRISRSFPRRTGFLRFTPEYFGWTCFVSVVRHGYLPYAVCNSRCDE